MQVIIKADRLLATPAVIRRLQNSQLFTKSLIDNNPETGSRSIVLNLKGMPDVRVQLGRTKINVWYAEHRGYQFIYRVIELIEPFLGEGDEGIKLEVEGARKGGSRPSYTPYPYPNLEFYILDDAPEISDFAQPYIGRKPTEADRVKAVGKLILLFVDTFGNVGTSILKHYLSFAEKHDSECENREASEEATGYCCEIVRGYHESIQRKLPLAMPYLRFIWINRQLIPKLPKDILEKGFW